MAESIGTARLDIVVDTSSLDAGVNKAKRSTQDMAKAAQDASQRMDAGTKRQVQALERQIATLGKSRSEVIRWRIEQQTSGRVAAELTAKLDAQSAKLATSATAMDKFGGAAKRMALAWAAIAAAAGGAALAAGIRSAVEFADKIDELSNRLGVSTEQLSAWGYAAKLSGTDLDELAGAIPKLSKSMAAALDDGSKMAEVFKAIGISVKDSSGRMRDVEEVLPEITDAFKRLDNDTVEAALAMELFGRSGANMLEFLNRGSDGLQQMGDRARELGIVIDADAAGAAAKFNDTLDDLKAAATGVFTQLAQALLPEMTKLVAKLAELASDGERTKKFVSDLSTVVSGTAKVFEFAAGGVAVMVSQLAALKTVGEGVINLDWGQVTRGFSQGLGAQAQNADNLRRLVSSGSGAAVSQPTEQMDITLGAPLSAEERAAFERRVTGSLVAKAKREGKSDAEREADRLQSSYASLAASQRERIALFGQESEVAKATYATQSGDLAKLSEEQKKVLISQAARIDQLRDEAEAQKELDRIEAQRTERTKDVLASIREESDLLGKSIEYQDTYNKLKFAGVDANSAYGQSIIQANQALHEQADATGRQIELMDTFRGEASSAFSDVITGAKSVKDAFKDMFDNIAERITQMIADRWIEQLFGQTGTNQSGSAGNWVSTIAGLFASANGNAFVGGKPVQAFANGGIFDRPTFFGMSGGRMGVMGEAGPEAIMPLERGNDGRLGVRMVGGGESRSVTNNTTFVLPNLVTRETQAQIAQRTQQVQQRASSRNR